jgi:uncharacterized protein (TIGR02246 family)
MTRSRRHGSTLVYGLAIVVTACSRGAQALDPVELQDFATRYATAWSSQDAASVAAFFADTASLTINDGEPATGREAITAAAQGFMTAFPDMVVSFDSLGTVGDRVAFHWTLVGTNTGPGGSGNPVRVSGHEEWLFDSDGLIADSDGQYDAAEYDRQVRGAIARIDHVIVSIDSLERGMALLQQLTGVAPVKGGVHPGRGTQNALLSLGPTTYLELLAPNPADSAGPAVVEAMSVYRELTPSGWAVHTLDAGSLHAALTSAGASLSELRPGSRATTSGDTLRWITFAPPALATEWLLPFFIEWVKPTPHPATTTPEGCRLAGMMLHAPDADALRGALDTLDLPVTVDTAAERAIQLVLDCPAGRVVLPADRP